MYRIPETTKAYGTSPIRFYTENPRAIRTDSLYLGMKTPCLRRPGVPSLRFAAVAAATSGAPFPPPGAIVTVGARATTTMPAATTTGAAITRVTGVSAGLKSWPAMTTPRTELRTQYFPSWVYRLWNHETGPPATPEIVLKSKSLTVFRLRIRRDALALALSQHKSMAFSLAVSHCSIIPTRHNTLLRVRLYQESGSERAVARHGAGSLPAIQPRPVPQGKGYY